MRLHRSLLDIPVQSFACSAAGFALHSRAQPGRHGASSASCPLAAHARSACALERKPRQPSRVGSGACGRSSPMCCVCLLSVDDLVRRLVLVSTAFVASFSRGGLPLPSFRLAVRVGGVVELALWRWHGWGQLGSVRVRWVVAHSSPGLLTLVPVIADVLFTGLHPRWVGRP